MIVWRCELETRGEAGCSVAWYVRLRKLHLPRLCQTASLSLSHSLGLIAPHSTNTGTLSHALSRSLVSYGAGAPSPGAGAFFFCGALLLSSLINEHHDSPPSSCLFFIS